MVSGDHFFWRGCLGLRAWCLPLGLPLAALNGLLLAWYDWLCSFFYYKMQLMLIIRDASDLQYKRKTGTWTGTCSKVGFQLALDRNVHPTICFPFFFSHDRVYDLGDMQKGQTNVYRYTCMYMLVWLSLAERFNTCTRNCVLFLVWTWWWWLYITRNNETKYTSVYCWFYLFAQNGH